MSCIYLHKTKRHSYFDSLRIFYGLLNLYESYIYIYIVVIWINVLTELGYVLICQVKEQKICSFENTLVEKSIKVD